MEEMRKGEREREREKEVRGPMDRARVVSY